MSSLTRVQSEMYHDSHPVPWGGSNTSASRKLLRKSLCLSTGLHLLILAIAIAVYYWKSSSVAESSQEVYTVSVLTLSEMDTLVPKGSLAPESTPHEPSPPQSSSTHEQRISQPAKPLAITRPAQRAPASSMPPKHAASASLSSPTAAAQPGANGAPNGQAVAGEQMRVKYQDAVASLLARSKRYPERAIKRRITGEATIRIELSPDGSLSNFEILRSTESSILDDELRAMVDRAAPFPPFPSDLKRPSLTLVIPVAFRLERSSEQDTSGM